MALFSTGPLRQYELLYMACHSVVDAIRGLADQERLQILLDGRDDQIGALREGAAAVAVEAVLIGQHLHDDQPHARRAGRRSPERL